MTPTDRTRHLNSRHSSSIRSSTCTSRLPDPGHKGEDRSFSLYTLAHIEFGAWFGLLEKDERDEITQLMANVKLPPMKVDLDQLTDLMERQVTALNAGIACDPAGTFVSLRADFDVYASPPAVDRAFFEAGPTNLLADREWAMLIDANVVTQDAARKAKDVLTTAPKEKLVSGSTQAGTRAPPRSTLAPELNSSTRVSFPLRTSTWTSTWISVLAS